MRRFEFRIKYDQSIVILLNEGTGLWTRLTISAWGSLRNRVENRNALLVV